jgi:hypothetical protein
MHMFERILGVWHRSYIPDVGGETDLQHSQIKRHYQSSNICEQYNSLNSSADVRPQFEVMQMSSLTCSSMLWPPQTGAVAEIVCNHQRRVQGLEVQYNDRAAVHPALRLQYQRQCLQGRLRADLGAATLHDGSAPGALQLSVLSPCSFMA